MELLRDFMSRVRDLGLDQKTHILIGVGALAGPGMARAINKNTPGVVIPQHIIDRLDQTPKKERRNEGIKICVEHIQEMMEIPGVSGIDIMDLIPDKWFPTAEIVERAGLMDRPQLRDPELAAVV